jgi:hypothetical protein
MTQPSFTTAVLQNVRLIPRSARLMMIAVGVISALVDVAYWAEGWKPWPGGLLLLIPSAVAISTVEYLGIMRVLRAQPSVVAYIRFACTSALVLLPTVLAISVLFAAPAVGRSAALLAFGIGMTVGLVFLAFLPAWPIAQAFSSSVVMPTTIFKATSGFRWGLVGAVLLLSAFNRQDVIPSVDHATDTGHAFAYAAGEVVMSTLSMMYTAAVAATAFLFACRNDGGLCPPDEASDALAAAVHQLTPEDAPAELIKAVYLKAVAFWAVVLVGLVLLFYFVPQANAIPQYLLIPFLVVIGVGFSLIIRRKQLRAPR